MKFFYLTLVSGLLLLSSWFLSDFLFDILWIFYLFPHLIFGICFLVFFVFSIVRRNKNGIISGIVISLILISLILSDSELFKSKKLLEASLIDDLSSIHLTLRENDSFEIVASTVMTEESFSGNYKFVGNKIIFNDKPYSNDFIPDTVYIIEDKVICQFDSVGNPITHFATYFEIKKNELKNAP